MADAKIKKFSNVTKLNYFHAYIVNMSFNLEIACNSSSFIYRYDFSETIVRYEFSQ